ncbi:solanesyl pyrophosphate synthase [Glomus cerebriforme]|uniref:Solanesyl pyrophosphate synthase n=1 Tax=Glomus cerebriforme TaxID=658196 RepID=A0A397SXC9_9GLOM|nr:solanesyl pyrophosphate synthase [Glomus cerebriforme]
MHTPLKLVIITKAQKSTLSASTDTKTPSSKEVSVQPTFLERISNNFNTIKSSIFKEKNSSLESKFREIRSRSSSGNFNYKTDTWNQAIAEAEKLVQNERKESIYIDPIKLVGKDLLDLTKNIKRLLGSGHPLLDTVSEYYFSSEGKHIRPLIVLLMSQATSIAPKQCNAAHTEYFQIIDKPLSSSTSSFDVPNNKVTASTLYYPSFSSTGTIILPTQRRLAEIIEMIHTASLFHDDVIDGSETRRNNPSANISFGNKMAILAGDFLLAKASVALARLRNPEVTELLATVIANLVEGEFMQLKNVSSKGTSNTMTTFEYYMEKTYMKTASLIAKSCRAASVLGGSTQEVTEIAYTYGRNIGLAFQLIDDMLDFVVSSKELGKPAGADLKLGLATAPVLYAWEEYPELGPLIKRKFSQEGDEKKARELVYQSKGIEQTKLLAASHCQTAINAILKLPESDARNALIQLSQTVLTRKK